MVGDVATAVRAGLGRCLEHGDFQVDVVQDWSVALEKVGQSEYDLLLVDLGAPGMQARALVEGLARSGPGSAELALSQYVQEQETLLAIGQMVSSSLQIDQVLQQVAEHMARLVNAASCAIFDWDAASARLTVQAQYVRPGLAHSDAGLEIGQTCDAASHFATAGALREREPVVVHARSLPGGRQERRPQFYHTVAGVPLLAQGRVIGLAQVYLSEPGQSFETHDLRLLQSLANQVAVAIDNARLFSAVQASEAAMRDLSLRLINVQEQERRYIAQELHDELGQILTAAKIDIDLARRKLARLELDDLAPAQHRLEEASALTDEMLTRVRALTVELRPTLLDDMGIVPTLRWYLGRFARRTGVQAQLEAPQWPTRLQAEIETTIYRVVQEALTNVARHAQASRVLVRLRRDTDQVLLSVEDDGCGFEPDVEPARAGSSGGIGLLGLRERLELLGGWLELKSRPGYGVCLTAHLPREAGQ
jgi:signal transduction histidine kinase